ncbi:MAG: hypothetical protein IT563_03550 [Alphaproteobacteria bacterium]|nr:hypothetical protein [Alphaproteobacteria bacterium]
MALTVTLSTGRWEAQIAFLWQIEYWPVLVRWNNSDQAGFIWKFLCVALRYTRDRR